jgi:hypothetical protein
MNRLSWVVFFLFVSLLFLAGCTTLFPQTPRIGLTVTPSEGHPSVADGGLKVSVRCSGGSGGTYEIDFGDGTSPVTCNGSAEHVYAPPFETYEYRVVARCGEASASRTVKVQNASPVFYGYYAVYSQEDPYLGLEEQQKPIMPRAAVELWVHYSVQGCDDCPHAPCIPYEVTGARDPDGDPLLFEWHIHEVGGTVEDTVFDRYGNPVNGVPAKGFLFVWFPTWREPTPPLPFPEAGWGAVKGGSVSLLNEERAVRLQGRIESTSPMLQELEPGEAYYSLQLTVSDYWGEEIEYSTTLIVYVGAST